MNVSEMLLGERGRANFGKPAIWVLWYQIWDYVAEDSTPHFHVVDSKLSLFLRIRSISKDKLAGGAGSLQASSVVVPSSLAALLRLQRPAFSVSASAQDVLVHVLIVRELYTSYHFSLSSTRKRHITQGAARRSSRDADVQMATNRPRPTGLGATRGISDSSPISPSAKSHFSKKTR